MMNQNPTTQELEIELDVLLTLQDHLRTNYWFIFRKIRYLWIVFLFISVVCPLHYFIDQSGLPESEMKKVPWGLFVPGAILLLILVSTYLGTKRNYKSNRSLQETLHYSFSKDGIRSSASSSSGQMAWENIR